MSTTLSQTILPFLISLSLYLTYVIVIVLATRHITNPSALGRSTFSRGLAFFASVLLLFVFSYYYLLKGLLSSSVWSSTAPIALFTSIVFLALFPFLSRPNPLDRLKYPGRRLRTLELPNIRGSRLLDPIESPLCVLYMFLLLILLPYLLRGLILIMSGQRISPEHTLQSLLTIISFSVILAPLVEEFFFRWIPLNFYGPLGLVVGTILWSLIHPIDRIATGITFEQLLPTIPVWLVQIVFYVKLWRGRYYWTAFFIHSITNLGIILAGNFLGVP
jgi:hypothetical protein